MEPAGSDGQEEPVGQSTKEELVGRRTKVELVEWRCGMRWDLRPLQSQSDWSDKVESKNMKSFNPLGLKPALVRSVSYFFDDKENN